MKKIIYVVATYVALSGISFSVVAEKYNPQAAITNAKLGMGYLSQGLYAASKDRLLSALRDDPEIAVSWYSMAYYMEKTGNTHNAEKYYRKAISVQPHSGSAMNNYGTFLCRQKQYQQSINYFLKAAQEPTYLDVGRAYENAGTCSLMMKNNTMAMHYFRRALLNNPNLAFALLSMAQLNHQAGNNIVAEKYFENFKNVALVGKSPDIVEQYREYVFAATTPDHHHSHLNHAHNSTSPSATQ